MISTSAKKKRPWHPRQGRFDSAVDELRLFCISTGIDLVSYRAAGRLSY
jgi:hypothetical protein